MKKSDLIALLMRIGVSKENAEKIASQTAEESTETFDLEALTTEWKQKQLELMKHEPDLVNEIRGAEMGKQRSFFEQKMKQVFSLTAEEMKDKKIEEIISLAKEKVAANSKSDTTTKELQEQIIALTNENKRLLEEEIPKIKNETVLHKKQFDIQQALLKIIPKGEDKLRIPFETASKLAIGDLNELYDIDLDDKGVIVLKEKGKDLIAKSKDGSAFLSVNDVINERLDFHKALVKSKGNEGNQPQGQNSNGVVTPQAGNQQEVKSAGLSKAEQHAAKLKEGVTAAPNL